MFLSRTVNGILKNNLVYPFMQWIFFTNIENQSDSMIIKSLLLTI